MAKFIMLAGVAGVGKTTLAELFQGNLHSVHEVEKTLGEDRPAAEIKETLEAQILNDLQKGEDCIYDARNLSAEERAAFLKKVRACDPEGECVCVVVQASMVDLLAEYERRNEYVPIKALRQMVGDFEVPSYHEGWDTIITLQR